MCNTKMVIKQHIRQSIMGTRKFAASAIHRFDWREQERGYVCGGEFKPEVHGPLGWYSRAYGWLTGNDWLRPVR